MLLTSSPSVTIATDRSLCPSSSVGTQGGGGASGLGLVRMLGMACGSGSSTESGSESAMPRLLSS